MSAQLNKSCRFYLIYWDDVLVGCISLLHQMSGTKKYIKRVHRIVILPDFQGLGIGTNVLNWMGEYLKSQGNCMSIRTSHFGMIRSLSKSPLWKNSVVANLSKIQYTEQHDIRWPNHVRLHKTLRDKTCHTFMYKGPNFVYEPLYMIIDETNNTQEYKDKIEQEILKYKDNHFIYLTWGQIGKWIESQIGVELMKQYKLEHFFYKNMKGEVKVNNNFVIVEP